MEEIVLPPGVPAPLPTDGEPVRRALETAARLWMDGDLGEAVGFVQKAAAICARENGAGFALTGRAQALSANAQELEEYVRACSIEGSESGKSTARVPSTIDSFSGFAASSGTPSLSVDIDVDVDVDVDLNLGVERHAEPETVRAAQATADEIARRFGGTIDLRTTLAQPPRPAAPSPSQPIAEPPPSAPASAPSSAPASRGPTSVIDERTGERIDLRRTLQQGAGRASPASTPAPPVARPPVARPPIAPPYVKLAGAPMPVAPKPTPEPPTRRLDEESAATTRPYPEPATTRRPEEGEVYPPVTTKK